MKQENAINQMISLSAGLIDLCNPLQELGIHIFNVMINYDNGRQIYLCNNQQWVRDYYLHKLYQGSLYDNNPTLFQGNEYTLWPDDYSIQPVLEFGVTHYDNRYGVTICHRKENYTAFYFFTGSQNNAHLPHFFINNFSLLENFINCLHNKKNALINTAYSVGLQRFLKEKDAPNGENAVRLLQEQQQMIQVKQKIIEQNLFLRPTLESQIFSNLSSRQKQVLYGLANGQSAQEIADQLYISRRTVERHLSMLKIKFPKYSYVELILELLNAKPKELLLTNL